MKQGVKGAQPTQKRREVLRDCIGHYLDSLPVSYGDDSNQEEERDGEDNILPRPTTFGSAGTVLD